MRDRFEIIFEKLAAKSYWQQFADSPEWVVMFLPDEGYFRAAWEQDPSLVETGVRSRVHIASPTTLIVLLQAIAHGWQQEKVAEDARVVHALGRELYERMTVAVGTHFAKLGATLDRAVGAYNETVGSLERQVLPTARKLGQTTLSDRELPERRAPLDAYGAYPGARARSRRQAHGRDCRWRRRRRLSKGTSKNIDAFSQLVVQYSGLRSVLKEDP